MTHRANLELLVATNNPGKILEIQQSLRDVSVKLRYLREFGDISSVEEIGATYEENAILKAVSYSRLTGLCSLADDSGLEVDVLGGGPGALSARYGGTSDQERTEMLLRSIGQRAPSERTARFVCCMALAGWPLEQPSDTKGAPDVLHICKEKCEGRIAEVPRGKNGFGYDPVFVPTGHDKTFAELPATVKNTISHRAKAIAAMREFLNGWITST
jgi:non-canonical purine NTP pyrophosphatase (RdgB/HAM1 family)